MSRKMRSSAPPARAPGAGPSSIPVPSQAKGPLAEAEAAFSRGDVRAGRELLRKLIETGPAQDRELARALLARRGPDPQALLVIAVVAVLILLALWLAIFRR
jgi:hypothetical protein